MNAETVDQVHCYVQWEYWRNKESKSIIWAPFHGNNEESLTDKYFVLITDDMFTKFWPRRQKFYDTSHVMKWTQFQGRGEDESQGGIHYVDRYAKAILIFSRYLH